MLLLIEPINNLKNLKTNNMTPTELARAAQLNAQIKIEINSQKVQVDRTVFTKSKAEKEALKQAKRLYNASK